MTNADTTATPERKRVKGRSPSYPGITLDTAIKRAQVLYDSEKLHPTPIAIVAKRWGYTKHTTGPASVTYAALLKYGLLEDEGSGSDRVAKLSDLAVKILLSPDAAERQAAVRTAALKPTIHAEMWQEYGTNLPPNDTLRYRMAIQGPFTESGFDDFIRVYRHTIDYAKLESGDKAAGPQTDQAEADRSDEEEKPDPDRGTGARRLNLSRDAGVNTETQTVAVPMIGLPPVMIEAQFPLTEQNWQYMMSVLTAMKPGLVSEPGPPRDDRE